MQAYRPLKLQQSPNLRQALKDAMRDSRVLLGVGAGIPAVATVKILAATSADWCWIDAEHTPMSPTLMAELVQTVNMYSEGAMHAVVRVPTHGHEHIAWALDAGAAGVMIPHTETVEQVQASIAAARFGPQGQRSFPPFAMLQGITDLVPEGKHWMGVANEHIAVIPQIESQLGLDNLEEIMQIEGVDAIMIGKTDLRLDLGLTPTGGGEAPYEEGMKHIYAMSKKYNMPIVGFVPDHETEASVRGGYRMICQAADIHVLAFGLQMALGKSREAMAKVVDQMKASPQSS
ncbi:Phosphoenolpyruvate/pyruvate domain-containing protein [Athelia psychrophila]|uniref:Phosphoenolpyruvate/pyruvate domain-containing protein n=1 Tax=Athelia psychrophila TaxID=1759441 RepID=A0A166KEQ1_9AGAM|nr:Phosphoenolpyruvate/pyruvate domain-containing protein [Fibularhizoctonia sp. CBS 109695]